MANTREKISGRENYANELYVTDIDKTIYLTACFLFSKLNQTKKVLSLLFFFGGGGGGVGGEGMTTLFLLCLPCPDL